jgi:hypothetical protein
MVLYKVTYYFSAGYNPIVKMIVLSSPFTFIFLSVYLGILLIIPSIRDFFTFWLFIEIITLVLIGISYTLFTNSLSQLMVYFFIQSLSSFFVLLAFIFSSPLFFTISLVIKIGIAPLYTWYLHSVIRFPNLLFFMVSTIHKLPVLFIICQFKIQLDMPLFWLCSILSVLVRGFLIIATQDLRYLLVASSIGNNTWLILSSISGTQGFLIFIFLYTFLFFCIVNNINLSYRIRVTSDSSRTAILIILLCLLSALPPSPLFLAKTYIVFNLFSLSSSFSVILAFLLSTSIIVSGYVVFCIKYLFLSYSHPFKF